MAQECQSALGHMKRRLTSAGILAHYDSVLPLVLTADASARLGVVISHHWPDVTERPIEFASRTLNSSERNYLQIKKEALALVFGIKKFHQYVYGRSFTLVTDLSPGTQARRPTIGCSSNAEMGIAPACVHIQNRISVNKGGR